MYGAIGGLGGSWGLKGLGGMEGRGGSLETLPALAGTMPACWSWEGSLERGTGRGLSGLSVESPASSD